MSASAGFQNNLLGNISINLTPSKINYNPENSEKFVTGAYVPPPKSIKIRMVAILILHVRKKKRNRIWTQHLIQNILFYSDGDFI